MDENHILRRLQPKSMWYLSILGTLATTQREYVALHAFRRLNVQVVLQGLTHRISVLVTHILLILLNLEKNRNCIYLMGNIF